MKCTVEIIRPSHGMGRYPLEKENFHVIELMDTDIPENCVTNYLAD